MTYQYYVAVSAEGIAGLAATKLSVVEETAAESGAEVIPVATQNAYLARQRAEDEWQSRRSRH